MRNYMHYFCAAMFLYFSTASSARPFDEVIEAMISVVPAKETDLKKELLDILAFHKRNYSKFHTYPILFEELQNDCWDQVNALLSERFKNPEKLDGWQLELTNIFVDKLDYRVYLPKKAKNKTKKHKNGCRVL